jgi:microcompartment protein CcmK/EutM
MIVAKIVGTVVATRKDERLVSNKLLVVRPVDPSGKPEGSYLVAVDTVDAGFGETVLIVSGSSARMASGMKDCPVDAAIVGIIDTIHVAGLKTELSGQPNERASEPAGAERGLRGRASERVGESEGRSPSE